MLCDRKALRRSVIVLALVVFGVAAVCPGQCVFAATIELPGGCHDDGARPVADPSLAVACCPALLAPKAPADSGTRVVPAFLLPAQPLPRWTIAAAPSPTVPPLSCSPPGVALYLRTRALLI